MDEFELTWKSTIEACGELENKWLNNLYGLREKWCPIFSHAFVSANIKSTRRSESMNIVFQRMFCKTFTLTKFVKQYGDNVEQHREAEKLEDYRCTHGKPYLRVSVGILNHAAEVYTCKIFGMFLAE